MKIILLLTLSVSNLYPQSVNYFYCQVDLEAALSAQYEDLSFQLKKAKKDATRAEENYLLKDSIQRAISEVAYETFKDEKSDLYHPWEINTAFGKKEAYKARVLALATIQTNFYVTLNDLRKNLENLTKRADSVLLSPSMTRDVLKLQKDIAPFEFTDIRLPECEFGQER